MLDYDQNSFTAINESYKLWKKHSPFLYNLLQTYPLTTCSQTIQWFSSFHSHQDWQLYSLLIGSNSLTHNSLMCLQVALPTNDAIIDLASYREDPPELNLNSNGYVGTMGVQNVTTTITIPQASEIMKARINKLNQQLIAAKTGGHKPELLVYDLRNKETQLQSNVVKLKGVFQEGYGLDWHPKNNGCLVSGSDDGKILIFDVGKATETTSFLSSEGVEDVKWSHFDPSLLVTAQKDEKVCLWDTRNNEGKPALTRKAHSGEVYSVDFNRKSPHLLLSGGEDSDVNLWDIRNLSKKLHCFVGHNDAVNVVAWNPKDSLQFISGSSDRKVVFWDVQRLSLNTQNRSGNEIVFIHGGHRSKVVDVNWGPEKELIASTQENCSLQVWKMNERISSD